MKPVALISLALALALTATAEKPAPDWRLQLLAEEGLSAETESLEKFHQSISGGEKELTEAIQNLYAEDFQSRQRAQKELLLIGKTAHASLREHLQSNDPEVRSRVKTIVEAVEGEGDWVKEELLRKAVASLLHERKNKDTPPQTLFAELFRKPSPTLKHGYGKFQFAADGQLDGFVADRILTLTGNHNGDLNQSLFIDAQTLLGKPELPDKFRVITELGGGPAGTGTYHVGLSIGNVRALFHPGFRTGAFRFQRVDDALFLTQNTPMGFNPPTDKLIAMRIDVERLPNGDVTMDVLISEGRNKFRINHTLQAENIGKLDKISLDRSGQTGGHAIFDNFIVDWGE